MSLGNSSKSKSSTTYNTTTENLNLQGLEGVTVAGNEGDTLVSITDGGAVDAMAKVTTDFLQRQNEAEKNVFRFADDAGRRAFDFADNAGRRAFDFADNAGVNMRQASSEALTFAQRAGENALKFAFDAGRPEAAAWEKQLFTMAALAGAVVFVFAVKGPSK